ncbi:hypothetical protein J6590_008447 [Homalodisca vitripennis]|nr:hypothetical protein J6590_008447 [Homalodisca vitripennis]
MQSYRTQQEGRYCHHRTVVRVRNLTRRSRHLLPHSLTQPIPGVLSVQASLDLHLATFLSFPGSNIKQLLATVNDATIVEVYLIDDDPCQPFTIRDARQGASGQIKAEFVCVLPADTEALSSNEDLILWAAPRLKPSPVMILEVVGSDQISCISCF